MDDQTPWEEIGGMVPVKRVSSLPAAPSSRAALAVRQADIYDLEPVDRGEFYGEIAPCLTLAAGVGMSQPDQDAWLEAAFIALDGIPIGLLQRGVKAAMLKADHPSKIIPAVVAEIGDSWTWRKAHRTPPAPLPEPAAPPERQIEAAMTVAQIEEMNAIMARVGASTRYRPDGSRFEAATEESRRHNLGPRRQPTRQDYIDLGVDPATLDNMHNELSPSQARG